MSDNEAALNAMLAGGGSAPTRTLFYGIIEQVRNNLIRCLLAGSLRCEKRRSRDGDLQLFLL